MEVAEYLKVSSERARYREYLISHSRNALLTGMLLFNDKTACCWGGPFPGNYAFFCLTDERANKYIGTDAKALQRMENNIREARLNKERKPRHDKNSPDVLHYLKIHYLNEYPTVERPYRLYMMGNDDTSYTMCFASEEEAREFIVLLEACQPLDIKDIQCSFAFTN